MFRPYHKLSGVDRCLLQTSDHVRALARFVTRIAFQLHSVTPGAFSGHERNQKVPLVRHRRCLHGFLLIPSAPMTKLERLVKASEATSAVLPVSRMITVTQTVLTLTHFHDLKDVKGQVRGQLLLGCICDLRVGHPSRKQKIGQEGIDQIATIEAFCGLRQMHDLELHTEFISLLDLCGAPR